VRSQERAALISAELRSDAAACGFLDFYGALKSHFGRDVRILYFRGHHHQYGQPHPPGVPFSDPPPQPLRKRK
jgi:hypothetical protein